MGKPLSEDIPIEIKELVDAIAGLPEVRDKLKGPLTRTIDSLQRRKRILTLVQEALSQLRLDIKYLMFDLESTRRERDEYKQRLEQ
jgi:hypothetical protein